MAAPTTSEDLLSLVRRSGLVEDAALDEYLGRVWPAGTPDDPAQLAEALVRDQVVTRFQADLLMQGKCRGMTLGDYKVMERIGEGGMALVYLCQHRTTGERVAAKVLPTTSAKDAESLKRFYREGRVAAALVHPNIVRVHDIDQDENRHYLIMEFIQGRLLQDVVAESGPLPVHVAAHYIRQAALGLQHAHEAGLVHRDIKPGNLILDQGGTVKVLDMGLARSLDESEEVLTKGVLGTPDYLAPEQTRDSHRVDIRADIYSLGCTAYFLLTGQTPFGEGTVAKKMMWHQMREPTPVRELRPDVPEGLAAIVAKMMAKDPARRYQTPAGVADVLTPWTRPPAEGTSATPCPEGNLQAVAPRVERPRPRHGTATPRPAAPATGPSLAAAGANPNKPRPPRSTPRVPAGKAPPKPASGPSWATAPEAPKPAPPPARSRGWLFVLLFLVILAIVGTVVWWTMFRQR